MFFLKFLLHRKNRPKNEKLRKFQKKIFWRKNIQFWSANAQIPAVLSFIVFVLKQTRFVLFFAIVRAVKIHIKIKKKETNCLSQLYRKIETWNFFQEIHNLLVKLAVNVPKVNVSRDTAIVTKMEFLVMLFVIVKTVKIVKIDFY